MSMLCDPYRNQGARTGIAIVIPQLAPECERIVVAGRELLAQIGEMWIELAWAWGTLTHFGKLIGMQIAPNGLATEIKLACNRTNAETLVVQRTYFSVACQSTAASVLALPLLPRTWFAF